MSETELQRIEDVAFQISQGDGIGIGLLWKDGSLYLSISKLVLTDGERWYAIPFRDLENIDARDDGSISLKMDGAEIRIKGENAERLMALRHLLLPLIDGVPEKDELMKDIIKMMLIGIKEKEIMASLLKKGIEDIEDAMERSEDEGYIEEGRVTEKGRGLLSEEEKELLRKAGVRI